MNKNNFAGPCVIGLKTSEYYATELCSYKTVAIRLLYLRIQQIWQGYNVVQENHSCVNISKWFFSKHQMCEQGWFFKLRHNYHVLVLRNMSGYVLNNIATYLCKKY